MGKDRKLKLCEVLNVDLLKIVGFVGHKGMNGDTLLYIDLHVCNSDIPCSISSVRELSLTCVCRTTRKFCCFFFAFFACGFKGFRLVLIMFLSFRALNVQVFLLLFL